MKTPKKKSLRQSMSDCTWWLGLSDAGMAIYFSIAAYGKFRSVMEVNAKEIETMEKAAAQLAVMAVLNIIASILLDERKSQ